MRFGVRTKSVQKVEDVEAPEGGDDNGDGNGGSTSIALTENNGVYTASFVMPTRGTVVEVNSEPSEYDFGDDY